jgi:hypothetical protein
VSVEVVTEEDGDVTVGWCEETGPAVVEQIALIDRLQSDGEPCWAKRRKNRGPLPLSRRPKGGAPKRALPLSFPGDGLPERETRNRGSQRPPPP